MKKVIFGIIVMALCLVVGILIGRMPPSTHQNDDPDFSKKNSLSQSEKEQKGSRGLNDIHIVLASFCSEFSSGDIDFSDRVFGLGERDLSPGVAMLLAEQLADLDAEKALRGISQWPEGEAKRMALASLFQKWGANNPEQALEKGKAMLGRAAFQENLPSLLSGWVRNDPRSAMSHLEQRGGNQISDLEFEQVMQQWGENNLESMLLFHESGTLRRYQSHFQKSLTRHLLKVDPKRAFSWVREHLEGSRQSASLLDLSKQLVREDPQLALKFANELPETKTKEEVLAGIAREWLEDDISAAFDWFETLPETAAKDRIYQSMMDQFVDVHVDEAAAWLESIKEAPIYEDMVRKLSVSMVERNREKALQWADSLPMDSAVREEALATIAGRWAAEDPLAAHAHIQSLSDKKETRARLFESLLSDLGASHPQKASQLIPEITDEGMRQNVIVSIVPEWFSANPKEVEEWMQTLPGSDYITAIETVIPDLSQRDPARALRLIASAQESPRRHQMLRDTVRDLALEDRQQAIEMIGNSALSQLDQEMSLQLTRELIEK